MNNKGQKIRGISVLYDGTAAAFSGEISIHIKRNGILFPLRFML